MRNAIWIAVAVVAVGFIVFRDGDRAPQPTQPQPRADPPVVVTALQLIREYEANEVAADAKYKGRRLLVDGEVKSITVDFTNDVVVQLLGDSRFSGPLATLDGSERAKAAALSKGQAVRLICEGHGLVLTAPLLSHCFIR